MQAIFSFFFTKITLFSILGIIGIVIGIPSAVYGLTLKGGESLGGKLILIGVLFLIVILLIDRLLVQYIKPLYVTIFEVLVLILFSFIFQGIKAMPI